MKRRISGGTFVALAAIAVTSVVAVTPGAAAPPPAAGACVVTGADHAIDSVEYELFTLINNHRAANGRARLPMHPDLNRAAAWMSRDMADNNNFPANHVDTNGRNIPDRFTWCGVSWTAWRENLAAHTSGLATDIFNLWVNSASHNTNMLATDVNAMGIGRAFNAAADFDWYFTQTLGAVKPLGAVDFGNDGATDRSVFRPSTGQFFVQGGTPEATQYGVPTDIPVPGDYNGDGFADKAVYRPSTGQWFVRNASPVPEVIPFGAPCSSNCALGGDQPVPADYDADGDTDIAVYRPSTGQWFFRDAFGMSQVIQYGLGCGACGSPTEIPVPADYTGDGKADIAIFRTTTGQWFVRDGMEGVPYGAAGDRPAPGDYNGDRVADIAVYRPSTGQWFRRNVSPELVQYGAGGACCGDVPVPGDYDWDGDADIAVYRRSTGQWFVRNGSPEVSPYGNTTDIPLVLPYAIRVWVGLPQ